MDFEKRIIVILISLMALFCTITPVLAADSPGLYFHVLMVYNTEYTDDDNNNSINDGQEIADYYMSKRGIPGENVCPINASTSEVITRGQYDQEYDTGDAYPDNTHIKQSIEDCLVSKGLKERIRFIVLAKGIPLKISTFQDSGLNAADYGSVEGAVALLFQNVSIYWRHYNPYYNRDADLNLDERFDSFKYQGTDTYTPKDFNLSYLVTRLDGYNVTEVLGMIDRASLTNRSMKGQWVLDDDPDCAGSTCDYMSSANSILCSELGLCDYISFEDTNDALTSPGDVNNNSVMGYSSHGVYGSGLGANAIENGILTFNVSNGSIYTSWESFNAYSYDDPGSTTHNTVADWLRFGGTGGIGSVYEPWCSGISRENVLFSRYAAGYTFAEAAYMSIDYLDFITSVAGDPIMTIVPDNDEPDISIVFPLNDSRVKPGRVLKFMVHEDYPEKMTVNHNGTVLNFSYPFTVNTSGWSYGFYNITIFANDSSGNNMTKKYFFEINSTTGEFPNFSKFDGNTTEFHKLEDRTNVSNAILEATGYGRIKFLENVNVSGLDIDNYLNITHNNVSMDSVILSNLNKSANITLNNLSYIHPAVYRDGSPCPDSVCTNVDYFNGTINFTVASFTSYSAGPNSNLTTWDETDAGMPFGSQTKIVEETVKFFANYTNVTSGVPVAGANCSIEFPDMSDNMTWNSSGFYEYGRNFSYFDFGLKNFNISCNATGFEPLTTGDDIFVIPASTENPPEITSPSHGENGSNTRTNMTWTSEGLEFTLQIDDDISFGSPEINVTGITRKYYSFEENHVSMDADKAFYARVKSNDSGWGYLKSGTWNNTASYTDNLSGSHYRPSITVEEDGMAHISWYGGASFYNTYYSNSSNWSKITDLTEGIDYSQYWPSIAVDGDGIVHIAWQGRKTPSPSNHQTLYANSTQWNSSLILTGPINYDQRSPSMGIDGNGIVHISWYGKTSANPDYYNIRYANSTNFSKIIEITSQNSYDQYYPSLDIGSNGVVHIAWYGGTPGKSNHVRYANSDDWGNINENVGESGITAMPSIKVGGNGVVHMAYMVSKPIYMNIRYVNSLNWSDAVILTNQDSSDQSRPLIGIESGGVVHVVWYGGNDDYPAKDNIRYANSNNWTEIVEITNESEYDRKYPSIAVQGNALHIAWEGRNSQYPGKDNIHYTNNVGYFVTYDDDINPPDITVESPKSQSYTTTLLWANITIDQNASWCGYSLNGADNVTIQNDSITHYYSGFTASYGDHDIIFYCNDTAGNMNSTSVSFSVVRESGYAPGGSGSVPAVNPIREFEVIYPPEILFFQGETGHIVVTINNTGDLEIHDIKVTLDVPGGWNSSGGTIKILEKNEHGKIILNVTSPESASGEYIVTLKAESPGLGKIRNMTIRIVEKTADGEELNLTDSILTNQMISKTNDKIREALEMGLKVNEARGFFQQALYYFEKKDYQKALLLAEMAYDMAEKDIRGYVPEPPKTADSEYHYYIIILIAMVIIVLTMRFVKRKTGGRGYS